MEKGRKVLGAGKGASFWVGTSGYSYREWKPAFYPVDLPSAQMLSFYGRQFPTVEINSSFYRAPTAKMLQGWADSVPGNFLFSFKAPQTITHIKRLKGVQAEVEDFLEATSSLEGRLGCLLFQLPPYQKLDLPLLKKFLPLVRHARCAFEFRHPSWFEETVIETLRDSGVALCFNDADVSDCPFSPTAKHGYLRLRKVNYKPAEIQSWAKRLAQMHWASSFVYFKHEDSASAPRLALSLLKKLDGSES